MKSNRRDFIHKTLTGSAALSLGGVLPGFSAKSYAGIQGANDRIKVAVMGVNSRGKVLASQFAKQFNCEVLYISDVDSRAAETCIENVAGMQSNRPKAAPDFRKTLEDKDLDALVIAAPDHWHAPAALLACAAGKHVFLEKPVSHNPHEGELLVAAASKYKSVIQVGNQRRSWSMVIEAIRDMKEGMIGRPYFAKTWYANNRPSIGYGKVTAVPSWLNYELWQGPAPRKPYKDNLIHYNWHWFWDWGTGESGNNGTHMIDLARWGLGVDYPIRVTSAGGRYRYKDDWQTPDTQIITMEFGNNTSIVWEGLSCSSHPTEGTSVGVVFIGEEGSIQILGNAYVLYDNKNKVVKEVTSENLIDPLDFMNPSENLDELHIRNFLDAIHKKAALAADLQGGYKSTLLWQLGNIALRTGNTLHIDPANGHIMNDKDALKYWSREYQPGWEPKV
jgi:predicted dehydrogenase